MPLLSPTTTNNHMWCAVVGAIFLQGACPCSAPPQPTTTCGVPLSWQKYLTRSMPLLSSTTTNNHMWCAVVGAKVFYKEHAPAQFHHNQQPHVVCRCRGKSILQGACPCSVPPQPTTTCGVPMSGQKYFTRSMPLLSPTTTNNHMWCALNSSTIFSCREKNSHNQ